MPHFVVSWILEARAQVSEFARRGREAITDDLANAAGLRDRARDQTIRRKRLRRAWDDSRERLDHAREVLTPYLQHHGGGEHLRYWATLVLLLLGDTAAGALVLIQGGEYPSIAMIMMLALGVAGVTCGLLGHDLRRRTLHRTLSLPKESDDDTLLVEKVFASPEEGWRLIVRTVIAAVATSTAVAAGTFAYRSALDGFTVGVAFGLWTVGIGAASWWNSWRHCDPARVVLAQLEDQEAGCYESYINTPIDAIEERARRLAAARETFAAHVHQGDAAYHQTLAGGARALAANPAVAGHALKGEHYLLSAEPPEVKPPLPLMPPADGTPTSPLEDKVRSPKDAGHVRQPRPRREGNNPTQVVAGGPTSNGATGGSE